MIPISMISEESDITVITRPAMISAESDITVITRSASAEDRVSTWTAIDVGISPDKSLESLVRIHIGFCWQKYCCFVDFSIQFYMRQE